MTTIREKGYHHWDGQFKENFRPSWPIMRAGIKLAFQRKKFKPLFAASFIPAFAYAAGIYISERLEDFKSMGSGLEKFLQINPAFFKSYLTLDFTYFMILLLMSVGGAGLIADDFRHKAIQLYFARPLEKKDYLLGKAGVVAFFVGCLTLLPALILFILKLLFSGSFRLLVEYPWLILSIILFSSLVMLFFTAFVLLCSSLTNNRNQAIALMFSLYFLSSILSGVLFLIFRSPYALLLSLKVNLDQVAAGFFLVKPSHDLPWYLSFLVLLAFAAFSYFLVRKKVRSVEVIK
jgi:ABC-type transport system involved in multi-copper enzyme maturation permease subunit